MILDVPISDPVENCISISASKERHHHRKKVKRVDKSGNHWWKLFFPGCFLHFMKSAAAEKWQVFAEVQNLNYLLLNLNSACNSVFTFSIVTNCENIFEIFSPGGAASSL